MEAGESGGLRKRKVRKEDSNAGETKTTSAAGLSSKASAPTPVTTLNKGTYWLTRIVLVRYIGFIYRKSTHVQYR